MIISSILEIINIQSSHEDRTRNTISSYEIIANSYTNVKKMCIFYNPSIVIIINLMLLLWKFSYYTWIFLVVGLCFLVPCSHQ